MATATSNPKTCAVFGATGGCASAALARALRAGYHARALVRTPSKLRRILTDTHGLPAATLDNHLTIIQGAIRDTTAVKRTLLLDTPTPTSTNIANLILTGIGGTPQRNPGSLTEPFTLDDPHVCESGMATLLGALAELTAEAAQNGGGGGTGPAPVIIAISTTGISARARDVPRLLGPLYHWALKVPHRDKRGMERRLFEAVAREAAAPTILRDFIVVRPTLLTDGERRGLAKVRVGWETPEGTARAKGEEEEPGPAVGYMISRLDVGDWIFEEAFERTERWEGKCVSLTY